MNGHPRLLGSPTKDDEFAHSAAIQIREYVQPLGTSVSIRCRVGCSGARTTGSIFHAVLHLSRAFPSLNSCGISMLRKAVRKYYFRIESSGLLRDCRFYDEHQISDPTAIRQMKSGIPGTRYLIRDGLPQGTIFSSSRTKQWPPSGRPIPAWIASRAAAAREAAGCPLDFARRFSRLPATSRVDRAWKSFAALSVHKIRA